MFLRAQSVLSQVDREKILLKSFTKGKSESGGNWAGWGRGGDYGGIYTMLHAKAIDIGLGGHQDLASLLHQHHASN